MVIVNFGKDSIKAGGTIESAVLAAGKNPDSFLFLVDGKPVPMDSVLNDDTVVEAVRVASGG